MFERSRLELKENAKYDTIMLWYTKRLFLGGPGDWMLTGCRLQRENRGGARSAPSPGPEGVLSLQSASGQHPIPRPHQKQTFSLREFACVYSRHPGSSAWFLASVLRSVTAFPGNPGNPLTNSQITSLDGGSRRPKLFFGDQNRAPSSGRIR